MNLYNVKTNSLKAWVLAARPKTLTAAAVPVMIGGAMTASELYSMMNWTVFLLCLLFALVMQIDANFVNDYFDFMRGNDDETRLGPKRACAEGWVTPKAMRIAIVLTSVVAAAVGFPLVFYGGWAMLLIGAACLLFCFLYTTKLSYLGLGDLLVVVFFGLVPVTVTYYLANSYSPYPQPLSCWLSALACGLVVDTLLVVNNFRDRENDLAAGKRTLVVLLGEEKSILLYTSLGGAACVLDSCYAFDGRLLVSLASLCVYLPFHALTAAKLVDIYYGRGLNKVLGMTSRNILIYGLIKSIMLLIDREEPSYIYSFISLS